MYLVICIWLFYTTNPSSPFRICSVMRVWRAEWKISRIAPCCVVYHCYIRTTPCGLRGCKNRPAPFPGQMSYKATKPGSVYFCLSIGFLLCCCLLWPLFVLLIFVGMCSVFWLFQLSCQCLPNWLERVLWGNLIMTRGSSPQSPGRRVFMIFLVWCIVSLFYDTFVLSPSLIYFIFLWHNIAYLCWKRC